MNENQQSQEQTQNAPVKKAWYKKWWVITIGVIILIGIIGSSSNDKNKTQTASEKNQQSAQQTATETSNKKGENPAEPAKVVPQITVTSVNISKEYSENEVAADAKYKGKLIEISGKVYSIDNGISDNEIIIRLSDGKYDINNSWCYMNESEREKAIALKKGQQVTLIGKGDSATMSSPVLKDCIIK